MPTFDVNGHSMYYEISGIPGADKAVVMGGWGTFCHGKQKDAPRYLFETYEVLTFDYRGMRDSTDDYTQEATMRLFADDLAKLIDHIGWTNVHIVGMVGMGACIGQELAYARPDLARTLVMTGTWAFADPVMVDQLDSMTTVHQESGFYAFQKFVASFSFPGDFYNENRDRLLGDNGTWADLNGNLAAHERYVHACNNHDSRERLPHIKTPSLVLHALLDSITTARHTQLIEDLIPNCIGVTWPDAAHVVAGKEQRMRFDALLKDFLEAN